MPDPFLNFLGFVLSVVLGIILTLLYWLIIWWLDRFEKEPIWLLALLFLWGAVAVPVLAVVFELVAEGVTGLVISGTPLEFASVSVIAPVVEEFFKGIGILAIVGFRDFDDPLDGLVYGATVGLGFALTENLLYFFGNFVGGVPVFIVFLMRSIVFGLNHALFTGAFGLFLGLAKVSRNIALRIIWPLFGFALALFMHAGHNALVSFFEVYGLVASASLHALTVLVFIVCAFIILSYERRWITQYLWEEVQGGLITDEDYKRACSWSCLTKEAHILFTRGWGDYIRAKNRRHLLAELALKKKGFQRTGNPGYMKDIEQIRANLRAQA
ncbi:MAG: PrsW family intramembrane metalloprotease [candidate division WOR-3 bacterium]